jgi:hypothetical protein
VEIRSQEDHDTALSASSALTTPPVLVADRLRYNSGRPKDSVSTPESPWYFFA